MRFTIVAATGFAAIAAAAPVERASAGLTLNFNQREEVFPPAEYKQLAVALDQVTTIYPGMWASSVSFLNSTVHGTDVTEIQCVAYHDQEATQIASCPFNSKATATLSSSVTVIGAVHCYSVPADSNNVPASC